jgi:hydroxylysine kinase
MKRALLGAESLTSTTGFSAPDIKWLAENLYGIRPCSEPKHLAKTPDEIFYLSSSQAYVLRISSESETTDNLELENEALAKLGRADVGFATPRVIASRNGNLIETVEGMFGPRYVRLFNYIPGTSVSTVFPSEELLVDIGKSLAFLDRALTQFERRYPKKNLIWAVEDALKLIPMVEAFSNEDTKVLVMRVFDIFQERVLPAMPLMRSQLIHNDYNPTNVLVDARFPTRVTGVIDFGDLTFGLLANDLAVAAIRHSLLVNLVSGIRSVCAGYTSIVPLLPKEAEVLFDLICLRVGCEELYGPGGQQPPIRLLGTR